MRKILPDEYPKSLLEIPQPPKELYIQGELPLDKAYLTVVGSRQYSSYGREVCQRIISGLAGYPFVIVSGLAIGIDAIAHREALDAGLVTVAVPGSGLGEEVLYPRSNQTLAKRIVESGGALVSELELHEKAQPYTFPKRNRIMAGLADGVLVIEAKEKSGSLITARLGLDYNKTIFAVPGSVFSANSKGTNHLIKEGATPVTNAIDILETFNMEHMGGTSHEVSLTDDEKKLVEVLNAEILKDDIARTLGWEASKLNVVVSSLELKGIIKSDNDKLIKL